MGCSASVRKEFPPVLGPDDLPDYSDGKAPYYCLKADDESKVFYSKSGYGSKEVNPAKTVLALLKECQAKFGSKTALRVERVEVKGKMVTPPLDGKKAPPALPEAEWTTWTYSQYVDDANMAARALMACGVPQFGTVGIYGFNSPEWFLGQVSAMISGAKSAGIYPSDRVENVVYKLKHSRASVCFMEDESKIARLQPQKMDGEDYNPMSDLPELKYIVTWAAGPDCPKEISAGDNKCQIVSWSEFMAMGEKTSVEELEKRQAAIKPGHCCALIYTSGTTGRPKAVMISHDNIVFEASCVMTSIRNSGVGAGGAERIISYLPLSHIAGMMVDIIAPMYLTACSNGWCEVSFARPYDLKISSIGQRLQCVKPTIFLGVPRVWEKIADKLKALGAKTTGLAKKLSTWAKPKLLQHQQGFNLSGQPNTPCCMCLANVVSKKVKGGLGLTELKYGFTGAAPIQKHTLEYFGSLGIQINEVYGMSECTGATTISLDETHEWGSCGFTMPGVDVKILREGKDGKYEEVPRTKDMFNAPEEEQGEICFRGRHIMMGYLGNPDFKDDGGIDWAKKKNEGAIDAEGWLHSGDKGCMDTQGMVKITGRYKELIIGAGGENVAPVPIEANVKKLQPAISNIMMVGDKRKYNIALISLKVIGATGEEAGTNKLDPAFADLVKGVDTIEQAMESKEFVAILTKALAETNKNPKVCPKSASTIKRFTILPRDFSVQGGELTSTLKLKRSVVAKMYAKAIDDIYAADLGKGECYVKCFGGDSNEIGGDAGETDKLVKA